MAEKKETKKNKKNIDSKPLEGVDTKAKKEKAPKMKTRTTTFYIGPGVKRGILDNGTIFRGSLPKEVEKLKEKYKSIIPLFVSGENYVKAINEVNEPGKRMNILFNRALEEVYKK
ncbi:MULTISPECIES: hypothetical protein [Psychrilyobacter]|uniref:Uncharacterized protein n=1 Tax=Psychrilyobacter piezotolerans TaxID=2293438 RepID=A0ABX9KJM0_9FUSO|nr:MULTISPECIES: hypothetical protein [Psychrilyobacter]MCS5421251.1 hypothetical protein [Psychrilyobacter sp. S5]NDI76992.1 hypothetical protein [Psychrilyobacter piezotolerans]RDE64609.1 hypothetical protein DV867_03450 [Psychrilyobacter sp. S5]REI42421.1 hypothetical protein DYH56_03450 [Psychrilyobacter piezotolerans]